MVLKGAKQAALILVMLESLHSLCCMASRCSRLSWLPPLDRFIIPRLGPKPVPMASCLLVYHLRV